MKRKRLIITQLALCLFIFGQTLFAQTTEFTYQGSLKNTGTPANGNFDFEFALFDAISGGSQVGSTVALNTVAVANGIFSVKLDFGNQFTGADRFLEIRVRPAGQPGITILGPRQRMNSAPYSVKSINTDNAAQLGGAAANQYVVTTDPRMIDSRPPTAGSANYIQNGTSAQPTSNFNISGNGTAGGTLSGNVVNSATQYTIGGSTVLSNAGTNNIFAGVGAGVANTTGTSNAFFGYQAGNVNTTGTNNSFFGFQVGISNTSGGSNSFFGVGAGASNSTGSVNSFFGNAVGSSNTTGNANSFFGTNAGGANTTGFSNSFFGAQSGLQNSTGNSNSFFGQNAGFSNTTGNNNTYYGFHAGTSGTTGGSNTIIGGGADLGANNLTNATAIGSNALVGQNNSLVLGSINGVNTATADTNVGIGTTSPSQRLHVVGNGLFTGNLTINGTLTATLPSGSASYIQNGTSAQPTSNFNISGNGTAGGTLSGNVVNATGQYNLGGNRILGTAGTQNVFVGVGAGAANTTGAANAFFGQNAGLANTSGQSNSFFGRASGLSNSIGNGNAFFGTAAGAFTTTGGNNVFLGTGAGNTNTIGGRNTIIGDSADLGAGNLTNAAAIGSRAFVTQSNSLVLGGINGINSATADTNVGIGTTAPATRLEIQVAPGQSLQFRQDSGLVPGINVSTTGGNGGVMRLRNSIEIWPSDDATRAGRLDVRNTGGNATISLDGQSGNVCAANITCASDERLKQNIRPLAYGLSELLRLRPVRWQWKDNTAVQLNMGLVAQEVAPVMPELILHGVDNKDSLGLNYMGLITVLIKGTQEQQAQIETLHKANAQQQQQIDELKAIVCSLKPEAAVCVRTGK